MKGNSLNRRRRWKKVGGWWTHTSISYFDPLITFANREIQEETWKDALWKALGNERFCWVTYKTNNGMVRERLWEIDICSHVSCEIGIGWYFPTEKEQEVIAKIKEAIKEIAPDLPKVFGKKPTFELTKDLQEKVWQILDCIVAKVSLVEDQRDGEGEFTEMDRDLPWHATHLKASQEILEMIRSEFGAPDTRQAVISSTGFLFFDDEGDDASRTLSWMLNGFVEVIFDDKRAILKKCRWCEKYFIHTTLHKRKYCSDHCRWNNHNKGPISKG